MRKMKTHRKHKGLLSVEFVVALCVLAVILGILIALSAAFGKLNNNLWARQVCCHAGQAQADAIAVTGSPIDTEKFQELWPDVECNIQITEGTGSWQGLQKLDLILSKKIKRGTVQVRLTRYLPAGKGGSDEN